LDSGLHRNDLRFFMAETAMALQKGEPPLAPTQKYPQGQAPGLQSTGKPVHSKK
jgi:hypothetical protein